MNTKASITPYDSVARVATPTAVEFNTKRDTGIIVVINVTAVSATPSVVPTIDGIDSVSGAAYNLLTGAAITGTGITFLRIHPAIEGAANIKASEMLPELTRITMTHADADSITYSVSIMRTT